MGRLFGLLAVLLSIDAVAAPAVRAELIVNGSFEQAVAPVGGYLSQIPTGWSSLGNGSTVDIISAGYSGSSASDGHQFVDLIGGDPFHLPSGLSQSVALLAGMTYTLSFDYNGARYNDGSQTSGAILEYSLGSLVVGSIDVDDLNVYPANGPATPWQSVTETLVAPTSGSYALTFLTRRGAFTSPMIDNVRLSAVPEPASLLSASLGLSLLAGAAVRRRRFAHDHPA